MAAMEGAKAELEALNLEGGAEQSPEQPRRFTGRRLAAATAAALALAVVGLAAHHLAGGRAGPAATSAAAAGAGSGQDAVQLFGEYGGCTCDCTFASTPNACIPEADDGNCCWHQCCRGGAGGFVVDPGFAVEPGLHPDYHGAAYHGSYYPQGQGGAVVVHHHYAYYSHSSGIRPYFWWYVLFLVLVVAACVGIYYYCWYKK